MARQIVTKSVTAETDATEWLFIPAGGNFDIFPGDGGVATIDLQRRDPNDTSSTYTVKSYASTDDAEVGFSASGWEYRLYCSAYTSGTILIGLWKP